MTNHKDVAKKPESFYSGMDEDGTVVSPRHCRECDTELPTHEVGCDPYTVCYAPCPKCEGQHAPTDIEKIVEKAITDITRSVMFDNNVPMSINRAPLKTIILSAIRKAVEPYEEDRKEINQFYEVCGLSWRPNFFGIPRRLPDPDLMQNPAFLAFQLGHLESKIKELEDKLKEDKS